MSRHNVTYKPGGSIAKPLDLTLKMQRVTQEVVAPIAVACIPNPTGPFWFNPATNSFDLSSVIGFLELV